MSNRNRDNRNRWDDDRNYDDYRNNDRSNKNWSEDSSRNTSLHQENWRGGGRHQDENYGLGDTSQGSANYGHVDDNPGARYYGTGNYGGYFGGESNQQSGNRRSEDGNQNQRQENNSSSGRSSYNSGSNVKGPRFGNSDIHGKPTGSGSSYGSNYNSGYGRNTDSSNSGYSGREMNRGGSNRNSDYGQERSGNWNNDRDWWDKTSDEVSSWFGDDDANRRREMDKLYGAHSGKGPKGYTRSDEKIKDDVEESLYHDSFIDASNIEVAVKDGEVTLTGSVENKQIKRRAEDCAERVTGVKEVSNHLRSNSSTSSYNTPEISSVNKSTNMGRLSESEQELDQSRDLNRTTNK